MRSTFSQFRQSRAPETLGTCAADMPKLASYVNEATQRLLVAGGETGWWGTWFRMVFNVATGDPYITVPRCVARLVNATVCRKPVRIQNEFYEFLYASAGLQPETACDCKPPVNGLALYDRGSFPSYYDVNATGNPKFLRFYPSDARDNGTRRILVQGLDQNGNKLRSMDNGFDIEGVYVTLVSPFADMAQNISRLDGIQKDISVADVLMYEVDSVTGAQRIISRYEPSEQNPAYRRYFANGIPANCCDGRTTTQITAMAKMEFIPVAVDQDWLLIGNIPALKLECEAVRYSEFDNPGAQTMSEAKHKKAVKILNEELIHYTGRLNPAVNFAPFGTAHLSKLNLGMT